MTHRVMLALRSRRLRIIDDDAGAYFDSAGVWRVIKMPLIAKCHFTNVIEALHCHAAPATRGWRAHAARIMHDAPPVTRKHRRGHAIEISRSCQHEGGGDARRMLDRMIRLKTMPGARIAIAAVISLA